MRHRLDCIFQRKYLLCIVHVPLCASTVQSGLLLFTTVTELVFSDMPQRVNNPVEFVSDVTKMMEL